MIAIILVMFIVNISASAFNVTVDDTRMPELYHLDRYDECLQADGLYCLGIFRVTGGTRTNNVYDYMVEYSADPHNFNRTLLHRGYCVSKRCSLNITDYNPTAYENCVSELMKPYSLNVELIKLHYCHTRVDTQGTEPTAGQIAYLTAVCLIVIMNIVGTLYDYKTKDDPKKIQYLMSWSVMANWKTLTKPDKCNKPELTAIHGIRVCVAIAACLLHSLVLHYTAYLDTPRALEQLMRHPAAMLLQNSTTVEQMFIVLAAFFLAIHLRNRALTKPVQFRDIPRLIAKRIFRLLPVTMLVVCFVATWLPAVSEGPMWAATAGAEGRVCRRKLWTHLLFINNLVDADEACLMPTWSVAVDFQLYSLATVVMVCLLRVRSRALLVLGALGALFITSCLLIALLAFLYDWAPMMYLTVSSEELRTLFMNSRSFTGLYVSPWGSMPACFLGLIVGYIYFEHRDGVVKINNKYKWLISTSCVLSLAALHGWVLLGVVLRRVTAALFRVAYAVMERSAFQILIVTSYIVSCVSFGPLISVLSWRGWHALSRLSLPVMMVHWPLNLYLIGSAPHLISASIREIAMYGTTTTVFTFILSVPITTLVELPMQKTFDLLCS